MGVDPAVLMLLLQLPAALHHLGRADAREARRDGVKVPAPAVVALDQPLGFAVEVVRRDQEIVRCQAVNPGQAGHHAHAAPGRLLKKLLGGHRAAGGEGHGRGRAAGQQCVEKVPGGGARVVAVPVFQFLGEDPVLQPIEQLIAEDAEDAELREVDVAVDEPGKDQTILQVRHRQTGWRRERSANSPNSSMKPILIPESIKLRTADRSTCRVLQLVFTTSKTHPRMAQIGDMRDFPVADRNSKREADTTLALRREGNDAPIHRDRREGRFSRFTALVSISVDVGG